MKKTRGTLQFFIFWKIAIFLVFFHFFSFFSFFLSFFIMFYHVSSIPPLEATILKNDKNMKKNDKKMKKTRGILHHWKQK